MTAYLIATSEGYLDLLELPHASGADVEAKVKVPLQDRPVTRHDARVA